MKNIQPILEEVKQALVNLYQDQLESIILYGSQARGDAREDSDIDILVVLKSAINPYQEIDKTSEIIAEICLKYDVFISYRSNDKKWVRGELLPRLEACGLKVCIDYRDFEVGVPAVENMERAVLTSWALSSIL